MKINHVGYLTNDIELSSAELELLGYTIGGRIFDDKRQNCRICMLVSESGNIELVEPNADNIQMQKLLKKSGCSPYHIFYEVDDVNKIYREFSNKEGWMNIFEPVIAPALENRLITYFYNTKIGFVEFVNSK